MFGMCFMACFSCDWRRRVLVLGGLSLIGAGVGFGLYFYFYSEAKRVGLQKIVLIIYIIGLADFGVWVLCSAMLILGAWTKNETICRISPWVFFICCIGFGACQNVILSYRTPNLSTWIGTEVAVLIGILLTLELYCLMPAYLADLQGKGGPPYDPYRGRVIYYGSTESSADENYVQNDIELALHKAKAISSSQSPRVRLKSPIKMAE